MPKPKGGRGRTAPYSTSQIRIPDPIHPQVHQLIDRYQEFIISGGDALNPPNLLDSETTKVEEKLKAVNKFIDEGQQSKVEAAATLTKALKLKANAGGAIKREIEKAIALLS